MLLAAVFALALVSCSPDPRPLAAPVGYERASARVPICHWQLVRSIAIDRTSNGQARRADRSIHLSPWHDDGQLWHEVGHIVMYASPDLERAWTERFWPNGRVVGTPVSRYARTNRAEDWAEAYKEYIEHGHLDDPDRDRFVRSVFVR